MKTTMAFALCLLHSPAVAGGDSGVQACDARMSANILALHIETADVCAMVIPDVSKSLVPKPATPIVIDAEHDCRRLTPE